MRRLPPGAPPLACAWPAQDNLTRQLICQPMLLSAELSNRSEVVQPQVQGATAPEQGAWIQFVAEQPRFQVSLQLQANVVRSSSLMAGWDWERQVYISHYGAAYAGVWPLQAIKLKAVWPVVSTLHAPRASPHTRFGQRLQKRRQDRKRWSCGVSRPRACKTLLSPSCFFTRQQRTKLKVVWVAAKERAEAIVQGHVHSGKCRRQRHERRRVRAVRSALGRHLPAASKVRHACKTALSPAAPWPVHAAPGSPCAEGCCDALDCSGRAGERLQQQHIPLVLNYERGEPVRPD